MCESMLVVMGPTYSCIPILDLSSRLSNGIGPRNTPEVQRQVPPIESFPLVSQSPTIIISKNSNNIEEAHVLFTNEDNLPNFDVVVFFIPYDVIIVPISDPLLKPTHITLVCVENKCRQVTNNF